MMTRLAGLATFLALAAPAFAHGAGRGEAKATVSGKEVTIEYGRPSLEGRDMLALAEVGKPWRMGADAATTLKTDADLSFAGASVPRGEYILTATKVAEGKWHLNVLSKERAKVADVPLEMTKLPASVETLAIDLTAAGGNGTLTLSWGDTALKAAFTGK